MYMIFFLNKITLYYLPKFNLTKANVNRNLASVNTLAAGSLELGELTATGLKHDPDENPHITFHSVCFLKQRKWVLQLWNIKRGKNQLKRKGMKETI